MDKNQEDLVQEQKNPDHKLREYSDNIQNLIDSMKELKQHISTGNLVNKNQVANTQNISIIASAIIDEKTESLRNQIDALFTSYKTSLKEDVIQHIRGKSNQLNDNPRRKKAIFSEKQFEVKDSLLTQMQKKSDFKTILNIILAMLIVLTMYIIIQQLYQTGNFNINFTLITWAFGSAEIVVRAWCILSIICCLAPVLLVKATHSFNLTKCFFIPASIVLHLSIYIIGIYTCFYYKLPPASAIAISCQSARMSMKCHAYIRDKLMFGRINNPQARKYAEYMPEYCRKAGVTVQDLNLPKISIDTLSIQLRRMFYFFFVPSLIYRDQYLHSKNIRLLYVLNNILGCLFSLMMTFVIFKVISIPKFKQMEKERLTLRTFLANCFLQSLSGTLIMVTGFFGVLHSWLSLMAELTRFADRRFYEDWWNVEGFEMYYRKWNIVVHEFLYFYVYKDCLRFTNGKIGSNLSKMFVFFVSVIFHEVVTTCMQGFFFPVMGLLFGGPGILFTKMKKSTGKWNLGFWILMMIGNGVILVLGSSEWYGRHSPDYKISLQKNGLLAVLTPVSIFGY